MSIDEWHGYGIPDDVIEAATKWLATLDSENVSLQQREEFMHWLDEDPTHRWAYEELAEIWAKTSLLQDTQHLIEQSRVLNFPATVDSSPPKISTMLPILTLLLIVLGFVVPFIF